MVCENFLSMSYNRNHANKYFKRNVALYDLNNEFACNLITVNRNNYFKAPLTNYSELFLNFDLVVLRYCCDGE